MDRTALKCATMAMERETVATRSWRTSAVCTAVFIAHMIPGSSQLGQPGLLIAHLTIARNHDHKDEQMLTLS